MLSIKKSFCNRFGSSLIEIVVSLMAKNGRSPRSLYFLNCAGSIVEGPTSDVLCPILEQGMETFIQLLKDDSVVVRDTTAWAIGR